MNISLLQTETLGLSPLWIVVIAAVVLIFFVILLTWIRRYKRCPSDQILVVFGRTNGGAAKCIHGGAAFIWPVIQDYAFLDLTPMSLEVELKNALSKQNIRVDVPSSFTIGISTEPSVMTNAAERLLGQSTDEIKAIARDIIFGQLRLVIATMDIEEINNNRDKFLGNVSHSVEAELKKIGLNLINVNITDIKDESGYIEALGKEAAAHAINEARVSVAQKNRDGSIGEANAHQDQRVKVSEANAKANIGEANALQTERTQVAAANAQAKIGEAEALKNERIQTAGANSKAIEGENTARISIAESDALRREKQAEAEKIAIGAEKVQAAQAMELAYDAERIAEEARAIRDKASQFADIVVPAEIEKSRIEINAEAQAENIRRVARGQADAIFAKKEAEAKGLYEILTKQAEGLDRIVKASGNSPKDAVLLLIADKLPELVKTQADAIKNIKIDKVTVWDSGSGNGGKDGKTSTANFLSGLYKSVPPLEEMFNMAGMELPGYLGNKKDEDISDAEEVDGKKGDSTNE